MVIIYVVVLCFWDFSNPSREKNKSRIIERDDISSLEHAYLCSLRLLGPDDVLRKGSGTLCESLLMNQARWGPQCCGNGVSWSRMVLYITVYRYCNTYHIHSYTCMITMVYIYIHTIYNYIYIYMILCMYIYIYMLTHPETYSTGFDCLLCFTVIFVGCCLQKQPAFFSFIWRLWMLEYDESWCFMCRYNDIFWWYLQRFRLPYCVPNKGFQFKNWQNAHGTVAKCQF